MSLSTLPLSAQQPGPALYVKAETIRKGEVQAVGHVCRWLRRPTPRPMGWENAQLIIDGTSYTAEATFATDDDDGGTFLYVQLRKWDGKEITLCLGRGVEQCSCEHATYRGVKCKHLAGLEAALDHLDGLEQAERLLANAQSFRDQLEAVDAPF